MTLTYNADLGVPGYLLVGWALIYLGSIIRKFWKE